MSASNGHAAETSTGILPKSAGPEEAKFSVFPEDLDSYATVEDLGEDYRVLGADEPVPPGFVEVWVDERPDARFAIPGKRPNFRNYVVRSVRVKVPTDGGTLTTVERDIKDGRPMGELIQEAARLLPRVIRLPDGLVALGADGTTADLNRAAALLGELRTVARVNWSSGSSLPKTDEFFDTARRTWPRSFETIERAPHFPELIPGCCYDQVPLRELDRYPGDGKTLDEFMDFFNPKTPHDRTLIKAFLCTLFWNGPPGSRPWFVLSSDESGEGTAGRAVGKSTALQMLGKVVHRSDGVKRGSVNHDEESLHKSLVNAVRGFRMLTFDNLKMTTVSCAAVEALITADYVDGDRKFRQSARYPNRITFGATINEGSYSHDMATRAVEIKLDRADAKLTFDPDKGFEESWKQIVESFIERNRLALWADIREIFKRTPLRLERVDSRWPEWASGVLGRVCESPEEVHAVLGLAKERSAESDADREKAGGFRAHIWQQCRVHGIDLDRTSVTFSADALGLLWCSFERRGSYEGSKSVGQTMKRYLPGGFEKQKAVKAYPGVARRNTIYVWTPERPATAEVVERAPSLGRRSGEGAAARLVDRELFVGAGYNEATGKWGILWPERG